MTSAAMDGAAAGTKAGSGGAPSRRQGWRALVCGLVLLIGVTWVYMRSPIITSMDSLFALQVAASFYSGDQGELTKYQPAVREMVGTGLQAYQVIAVGDRLFSAYPIGTPLLVAPLLGLVDQFDPGLLKELRNHVMMRLEQRMAAVLAALATLVLFLALRRRGLGLTVSLAGALTLAFSTTLWSQASRALWQHGPLLLAVGGLLWALATERPRSRDWLLAGLCAGLAYLIRPPAAAAMLPFCLLALTAGWRAALAFGVGGAVGTGLALGYNAWAFGTLMPLYFIQLNTHWDEVPGAIAGLLISPSRGLLIFSPVLLLAGAGLSRRLRGGPLRPLDWAVLAALPLQLAPIAVWQSWGGGYSYGPRLQTDLLPYAVWFLCLGLAGLGGLRPLTRRALLGGFVVLFALGAVIHSRGAFDPAVHEWNDKPEQFFEWRAWDWSDPQFLRGW